MMSRSYTCTLFKLDPSRLMFPSSYHRTGPFDYLNVYHFLPFFPLYTTPLYDPLICSSPHLHILLPFLSPSFLLTPPLPLTLSTTLDPILPSHVISQHTVLLILSGGVPRHKVLHYCRVEEGAHLNPKDCFRLLVFSSGE